MDHRRHLPSGLLALLAILASLALAAAGVGPSTPAQAAPSPNVVISQVYGGGGNTGAPYKNDFVELFNRGTSAVDLSGWSVQYASATGSGNFGANSAQLTALSGSIAPGGYILVGEASGGAVGADLPAPVNQGGGINLSATAGKVALVKSASSLGCNGGSAPCSAAQLALIVDLVGYGNANFFEGAPAPTLSNSTAAIRAAGGCNDTDNNTADFAAATPAPRNSATASNTCGAATPTPTPTPLAIHAIQGAGHVSPFKGQSVGNVPGVVTAKRSNGFYLQETSPDADDRTSEGIFVFTSSAPSALQVGDGVVVTRATVQEFRPGGAAGTGNLTTTELSTSAANVTVLSHGNPLPTPVTIGQDGRVPPTTVIEDDAAGDVETSGTFDPTSDGIDFYESLEGMLVQVADPAVVGPTNRFGEVVVLANNGVGAAPRTNRAGILLRPDDPNPERIVLDDEILKLQGATMPMASVGDRFAGTVTGVMDYSFGNFFVELTSPPTLAAGGLARESTDAPAANQLSVATFNVENLDPGDGAAKFDALAQIVVNNLRSPDLIALEEVQDNNGATDDGTVDATQTLTTLAAAIQAAGGPSYQWRQIDPVNDQDGGEPGGNIRVAFLFRADRGLQFVDRPGGTSTATVSVASGANGPELSFSPGRVDPTNHAFDNSRKPLAGEFTFNGRHFFALANHFNSKGGDSPLFGHLQPQQRPSEVQRHQQAQIVHDFLAQITGADPGARIVVLGDLNDFEFSDTVSIVKAGILTDLMDTLPPPERYSYVFEGNSQTLDHILASSGFTSQPFVYDVVHVNAEFWDQISDHDPQVARFTLDTTAPTTSAAASPAPNGAGWNSSPVTVSLSALDDPLGVGVRSVTYALAGAQTGSATVSGAAASVNVSAEGTTTVTYSATDKAGNTEAPRTLTLRIDATPPTVTYAGNAGSYTVDQSVQIACGASDALSGLATTTCADVNAPAYTFHLGPTTLSASATDVAGNVGSGATTFTVGVTPDSLCALVGQLVRNGGIANSLCVKIAHVEKGNRKGRAEAQAPFVNEVEAQRGKALTSEQAELLIRLANAL
jgi:predicted extracellular nuclease